MVRERHRYPTALLADAAAAPIAMAARIRPAWPGASVSGRAFTVRTPPGEHRAVREAALRAGPGEVIVVDGGSFAERALWGDRMARLAAARGVAGVVIDGAVRDAAGIEELGFPVFAAAIVPTPPRREAEGETGVPIVCGGISVSPGDWVVGDRDGVVVIPAADVERIAASARELAAGETEAWRALAAQAGIDP